MEDVSEFLRARGVQEETILQMEEQKIDSDVIGLMDDATLQKYIPSYGDRIAIFNHCRSKRPTSKRKKGLYERLREKMTVRSESSQGNASGTETRKTQTKKLKATRNIEIGWIHNDTNTTKQVRAKQGGGTRTIKLSTNAGLNEILETGKTLFFPDGISPKGPELEFDFEVWDFKQNCLTAETCPSISTMYKTVQMTMLRFYIATKRKPSANADSDTVEETSEFNLVSGENDDYTDVIIVLDDIQRSLNISSDPEITFGPHFGIEEDEEDTLIFENVPVPASPLEAEKQLTITVHHANTLADMITAFSDAEILNKSLNVRRILPDNKEEAGSGSGVLRDVLSCFWQEFYERCTLGTTVKVPYIRHDFPAETWRAIGRILLKGYQDCEYFPNKLSLPFLEHVLFDNVYSDLKAYFMQFVSSQEREVLMQALTDFTAVDTDDLLEVLDSYGCRRKVSAENLPKIIEEIAHKEMVQKPMFVIDCWREINHQHLNLSPEALTKLLSDLQPTTKKVCKLLKFDVDLTTNQKEVANHLKRFIRELDESKLQKCLRFCTGSDLIVTDSIYVGFEKMTEFTRRPIAHTCGNILHIADSYENFPDFRSEFNAVLESNVWVMDIV
ncbi:uncharacterized protein LOC117532431 [Gymnodraco acuticeps]|uniref:Uncharacterized protein LOC117532431 n=1 Tax=Gymnodraco acuticeps TaxID=8218 RepID=A0A6P8T266_GYMAC|nr:uncharacterized protein LOC117532431 [Gymnodraco acuticeps]